MEEDRDKQRTSKRNPGKLSKLRFWRKQDGSSDTLNTLAQSCRQCGQPQPSTGPPPPPNCENTFHRTNSNQSKILEGEIMTTNGYFVPRGELTFPSRVPSSLPSPQQTNEIDQSTQSAQSTQSVQPVPAGRRSTSRSFSRSRSSSLASSLGLHIRHRPQTVRNSSQDDFREPVVLPPLTLPPLPGYKPAKVSEEVCTKLQLSYKAVQYAELIVSQNLLENNQVCALLSKDNRETTQFFGEVMRALLILRFKFLNEPVDISLRRLLYGVTLPEESQQIERVLSAFSSVWFYFNPGYFDCEEDVLSIVFALVMLHTDIYNKNVKHKISKRDFVSHAAIEGIAPEILEYFYDNICAVPFKTEEDYENDDESSKSLSLSFNKARDHPLELYLQINASQLSNFRPALPDPPRMPFLQLSYGPLSLDDFEIMRVSAVRRGGRTAGSGAGGAGGASANSGADSDANSGTGSGSGSTPGGTGSTPGGAGGPSSSKIDVPVFYRGVLKFREPRRVLGSNHGWREGGGLLTGGHLYMFKYNTTPELETTVENIDALLSFSTTELAALITDSQSLSFDLNIGQQLMALSLHERDEWVRCINAVGARASVKRIDKDIALEELNSRKKTVQQDLDGYIQTCRHFRLLAPLTQRSREGLAFAAGRYSSRCDDCFVELAKLESYINYFTNLETKTGSQDQETA